MTKRLPIIFLSFVWQDLNKEDLLVNRWTGFYMIGASVMKAWNMCSLMSCSNLTLCNSLVEHFQM